MGQPSGPCPTCPTNGSCHNPICPNAGRAKSGPLRSGAGRVPLVGHFLPSLEGSILHTKRRNHRLHFSRQERMFQVQLPSSFRMILFGNQVSVTHTQYFRVEVLSLLVSIFTYVWMISLRFPYEYIALETKGMPYMFWVWIMFIHHP